MVDVGEPQTTMSMVHRPGGKSEPPGFHPQSSTRFHPPSRKEMLRRVYSAPQLQVSTERMFQSRVEGHVSSRHYGGARAEDPEAIRPPGHGGLPTGAAFVTPGASVEPPEHRRHAWLVSWPLWPVYYWPDGSVRPGRGSNGDLRTETELNAFVLPTARTPGAPPLVKQDGSPVDGNYGPASLGFQSRSQAFQSPAAGPSFSTSGRTSSWAFFGLCAACGVQILSRVTCEANSGSLSRKPGRRNDWNHPRLGYRIHGGPGWNGSPHTYTDPIRWVHRFRRRIHIRRKVEGTSARPRLAVFRSKTHMHALVVDDTIGTGVVMAHVTSKQAAAAEKIRSKQGCGKGEEKTWSIEAAEVIGEEVAKQCLDKGITMVVFDRGGFRYEGRVKALAEAARTGGLHHGSGGRSSAMAEGMMELEDEGEAEDLEELGSWHRGATRASPRVWERAAPRHIIRKFKALEAYNESNDAVINSLKDNLETRATIFGLEEAANELSARLDTQQESLLHAKENITLCEEGIDRLKGSQTQLEKKLDTVVKEKAVQDRLIRETQDALLDKVSLAELNMFEAKFAGYTTKLEHQQMLNSLSDYATIDLAERIAENMKVLSCRFDDYTRTAKLEQQLQERRRDSTGVHGAALDSKLEELTCPAATFRDWVEDELQYYAKVANTNAQFEELAVSIKDQSLLFESAYAATNDQLRGLSDRLTAMYSELVNDLQQRAMYDDLQETKNSLKTYALRAETDAFQQDCVPKLRFCVDSIRAFDERLRAQDPSDRTRKGRALGGGVLLDKAGKYDIVIINSRVEQCLQKEWVSRGTWQEAAMKEFHSIYDKQDRFNARFEEYVEQESKHLDKFRPPDYGPYFEDTTVWAGKREV
eukprot:g24598.t1